MPYSFDNILHVLHYRKLWDTQDLSKARTMMYRYISGNPCYNAFYCFLEIMWLMSNIWTLTYDLKTMTSYQDTLQVLTKIVILYCVTESFQWYWQENSTQVWKRFTLFAACRECLRSYCNFQTWLSDCIFINETVKNCVLANWKSRQLVVKTYLQCWLQLWC